MARVSRFIYKSNKRQIIAFHIAVGSAMIRAATRVVWRRARQNARKGFKGGRFADDGWKSVGFAVKTGLNPYGQVGSTLAHFSFWETGHINVFTRQYERNRWLSKAFIDTKGAQKTAAKIAATKTVGSASVVLRKSFISTLTGRTLK